MKSWKTILLMSILSFSMSLKTSFSSEKISDLVSRDASDMLDSILLKKIEMSEYQGQLEKINLLLKKTKKGQVTYLQFDRIAGSLIIVGVMVGSYKTQFPPGLRAMIAAYTTVSGVSRGMVKLTPEFLRLFVHHVTLLNGRIANANAKLDEQVKYYCKNSPDHELCL